MSEQDGKKKKEEKEETEFRIRDLPDLRRLRKPPKPGAAPDADGDEVDFGLKRSTPEEAWKFFRETVCENPTEDELTEFLDDD